MKLRAFLVVAALGATANAQPDVRDHRHPGPPGHGPVVVGGEPTEAPPAPQAENVQPRAGFAWVSGQWDWKGGKWAWTPGHWERERKGKHWRASRWENQGGHWKLVSGDWEEGAEGGVSVTVGTPPPVAVPPPAGDWPSEAPPPPRDEPHDAQRAGFVWVPGQWDWKAGKYDWTPGHWERERAGKKWREAHWDNQNGHWVRTEGDWIDEGAAGAPPPPPNGNPGPMPPDMGEHHHHEWRLERPTVSSYWPAKGKAGTKVVIRGVNFPESATVMFDGKKVLGEKVKPDKIEFVIPPDGTTGDIAIDRGHGRPLAVGPFEVAAGVDPMVEQKRIDDERRKEAEAQWAAQQKEWAKDRAAREAKFHQHEQELESTREQRREEREKQLRDKWNAAFLADADTQDELTLHAQRLADLQRVKDIAGLTADTKLGVRVDIATQKENDRHEARMQALQASFKTKGGAP